MRLRICGGGAEVKAKADGGGQGPSVPSGCSTISGYVVMWDFGAAKTSQEWGVGWGKFGGVGLLFGGSGVEDCEWVA